MTRPRPSSALALTLSSAAGLASCGGGAQKGAGRTIIQDKGSDTMVNVAQVWAEEYRKVAPNVEVEVSGGGSGVGLAALVKGTVDIANASRDIKPAEVEQAQEEHRQGAQGTSSSASTPWRSTSTRTSPLQEISLEQLAEIFAENGKFNRWSDLGVKIPGVNDDTIVRVSRQSSSGTYEFFREHVLGNRDFRLGSRDLNGSKEVVELVASTPTAIGYSGMGYATAAVKKLKLASKPGAPAVEASVEAVHDRDLPPRPLAARLHPRGAAGRAEDLHRLDPLRRRPEGRRGQRLRARAPGTAHAPLSRAGSATKQPPSPRPV